MTGVRALRVAVIGAGYWGPNLVRAFERLEGVTVAAVCDASAARLEYARTLAPGARLLLDVAEVWRDDTIDAVAIATPPATHATLGRAAIEAGKHLLVEKPLATTAADAEDLVARAAPAGLTLAVGHVYLYHPAYAALLDAVRGNVIGGVAYVQTNRANVGPPVAQVDVMWDLAVHDLSMTLHLMGCEATSVQAFGQRVVHPEHTDTALIVVRYADGRLSSHAVSWLSPVKLRQFHVGGTAGFAVFDETDAATPLTVYGPAEDNRTDASAASGPVGYGPGAVVHPAIAPGMPLDRECAAFVEAIRSGAPLPGDGASGVAVVRVLQAAAQSLRTGSAVALGRTESA